MGAMASLVDAVIAVSPFPFVAVVAFPITCVRPLATDVAEHTSLQSLIRIIFARKCAWRCNAIGELELRFPILVSTEDVRILVGRRVTTGRSFLLIEWPGSPAKAIPVLAAFLGAIAGLAEVVGAIVATGAVVMQVVFYVIFVAGSTGDVRFRVLSRRRCG